MNLLKLPKTAKQKNAKPFFKQQVIAISALSLFGASAFAQTGFDFGLKGMIQSSSMVSLQDQAAGNELNYKDRLGIGGGVGVGYSFTKHIGAEIDFLYSQEGTTYTGDSALISSQDKSRICTNIKELASFNNIPLGNYSADFFLNYIKIPILFRYNMNNTKKVFFSMFIGPQFDILSSASIKINGHSVDGAYNLKTKDMFKSSETDGVLGLGLGINLSKNWVLSGHLRFDYGFGDAENKNAKYTPPGGTSTLWYPSSRSSNTNATGGGLITIAYKLLKKDKEAEKKKEKKKLSEEENKDDDNNTETPPDTKTTTAPAMQPAK